ncbi:MAG: hypothetical protein R3E68_06630 [Burkholderiaceae bacterium]
MKSLRKTSLRTRLALPLFVLVAGIIAAIGLAIHGQTRLADRTLSLSDEELPYIARLSDVSGAMNEAYLGERASLMMDVQSPDFAGLVDGHQQALQSAATGLAALAASGVSAPGDMPIPRVRETFEQWAAISRQVMDLRGKDTRMSRLLAVDLSGGDSRKQFDALKGIIRSLTENHLKAASANVHASLSDSRSTLVMLTVIGSIVTLFGLLVAWQLPYRGPQAQLHPAAGR